MIESPLIKEIVAESTQKTMQEAILEVLEARFGNVPEDISEGLRQVRAKKKLKALVRHAARCPRPRNISEAN